MITFILVEMERLSQKTSRLNVNHTVASAWQSIMIIYVNQVALFCKLCNHMSATETLLTKQSLAGAGLS